MKCPRKFFRVYFEERMIQQSRLFIVATVVAALLPGLVSAQIVISEFLYDAPGADTDQEFVELFNAGSSAVDLTQWKINDGSNHTLNVPPKNGGTGSITIAPGAYIILVDNATDFIALHSGLTASVIDTVLSLTNTADTISLIDEGGTIADSISYTKDQGGAGDGNSLARVSVSGTNLTSGTPTLGTGSLSLSGNPSTGTDSSNTTTPDQGTQATTTESGNSASSSFVSPPEVLLFADAGSDRAVIVGADTEFRGRAYNRKKEDVGHARLVWNFGDGSTSEGPSVLHHFDYPGRYVVVLTIAESKNAASDQIIVTAELPQMRFSIASDGSVSIENHSNRTLDFSRWMVRQSGRSFVLPEHSLILGNATMRISQRTLGFLSDPSVELVYPNGVAALRAGESTDGAPASIAPQPMPQAKIPAQPTPATSLTVISARKSSSPPTDTDDTDLPLDTPPSDTGETASSTQVAAAVSSDPTSYLWWLGAFGLAALAAGSLVLARRFGKREWDIVEEKPE